jgi:hypothetical protein
MPCMLLSRLVLINYTCVGRCSFSCGQISGDWNLYQTGELSQRLLTSVLLHTGSIVKGLHEDCNLLGYAFM